jgi:hypothetical protein
MSELLFGFKDLVNVGSASSSFFDISSILLNEKYLKAISPKRYDFYVKFVSGLANPEALEKFFYKTNDTRQFKEELNEKAMQFNKILKKFYDNLDENDRTIVINNIKKSLKIKFNYNDDTIDKIISTMKMSGGGNELDDIKKNILDSSLNKGKMPMKEFLNKIENVAPEINPKPIENIEDLLITKEQQAKINEKSAKSKSEMIKKLRPIYNKYKDDVNPDKLKIKLIDRVIFIATTFLIRYITLMIIEWGLSTNLINNFYRAFLYYCFIYLLFFIFIVMLVNVIVHYPLMELYSSMRIISIPNLFYYFYIYTNGYLRLLIHIFLIIIILFIPYIINIDKINFIKSEEKKSNISYDYDKKKKILDSISIFSFIIWILTSIIASKN